jgi:hypothetical protein
MCIKWSSIHLCSEVVHPSGFPYLLCKKMGVSTSSIVSVSMYLVFIVVVSFFSFFSHHRKFLSDLVRHLLDQGFNLVDKIIQSATFITSFVRSYILMHQFGDTSDFIR